MNEEIMSIRGWVRNALKAAVEIEKFERAITNRIYNIMMCRIVIAEPKGVIGYDE